MKTPANNLPVNDANATPGWLFWCTVALLFLVSFVCEQNLRISTQFAYTQTLDEMTSTAEGGNALRRVMFLLLGGSGVLFFVASLNKPWKIDLPLLFALLLVPAWCVLSLTWAIDFGMATRRLIVLVCCVSGAIGIGRMFSLREICRLAFFVSLATSLVGVGAELACGTFRPWSGEYRFAGTVHPNTQGMYLAALVLSSFTLARLFPKYRGWYLVWCGIGLLLLVLTKSRTATAAVMLALASLWLMQTNWRWQAIVGGGAAWSAALVAMLVLISGVDVGEELKSAALLGREEQTESFTGRGDIWPVVMEFIAQRPLTGHGFESFWTPAHIAYVSDAVEWPVREAHSGYLEALLHLGAIGLVIGLAAVWLAWGQSLVTYLRTKDPACTFLSGMLVFALIDSTMESGMITPQTVVFLIAAGLTQLATNAQGVASPATPVRLKFQTNPSRPPRLATSPSWK